METNHKFRIKDLVIPILIKFGIDIVVSSAFSVIYMLIHIDKFTVGVKQDMQDTMQTFITEILQYTVEITTVSALVTLPIFIWMFRKDSFTINKGKTNWITYLTLVIIGITSCIAMNNLLTFSQIARISPTYQELEGIFYAPPFWLQLIGLGIIIPIVEEVLYRGVIFRRLRVMGGAKSAILASAALFGMAHGNLVQFIYAFCLGVIFAYLYEMCETIWVPICLHVTANLISVIMTETNIFDWMFKSFLHLGATIVGCTLVCSTLVVFLKEQMLRKY